MSMGRTSSAAVAAFLAGAALLWSFDARAFLPAEQNPVHEVPLAAYDRQSSKSMTADAAGRAAVERLTRTYDGEWRVFSWNPDTSTPRWIYGSGPQVAAPFTSATDLLAAARNVMQKNPEAFRVHASQLRYESAPRGLGKWSVHFQQTNRMLDVWGGKVSLTFTDGGRLVALGSSCYDGIDVDERPAIDLATAKELARRDLPFNPATDAVEEAGQLLILPVPQSEGTVRYHLAWRVRVRTEEPLGIWVTHLDAHDGEILWRYNDVHFLDYTGTASGLVQRPSYCAGQTVEAFPYLRIQPAGLASVYADAAGNWAVPYGGLDARTVTADLYSPYVDLNNIAGAEGTFTGTATPGTPLAVSFTDLNAQRDEKSVYRAVNDIHDLFQQIAPEFAYPNQRINANVSRNSTCNAYWDGTINFYLSGDGCANTGEIMDVVQHEFGHGVQAAILGYQGDEGLGEGNADVLGNLMQMEHVVGRGFYLGNCVSGIRDSQNNLVYPDDVVGQEIHDAGRVIAGFHWDAMTALILQHGEAAGRLLAAQNWHYGRLLQHPTIQPDQVLATFIADDDDGDLTNGTPNFDAYCLAAENHGFSCPVVTSGITITHAPVATHEGAGPVTVTATITTGSGNLVADSLRLNYRVGGGSFQSLTLAPTGGANEFSATIPGLAPPAEVEYYLRARDTQGHTRTHPMLAPAYLHAFDVATVYDPLEAATAWTVNAEGTDNASTGQWVRLDPTGTIAQPEDDHTVDPGTICWVTGNAPPGSGDGAADVDGGTTTLLSPAYDLTGAAAASVKFARWYSNDRGAAPGADTWTAQVRNNGGPWLNLESTTLSSNEWVTVEADLVVLLGGAPGLVEFRFVASDLDTGSLVEAAVDDLVLLAQLAEGAPAGATDPPRFALGSAQPNPTAGSAQVSYQVPVRARVDLRIFDVSGRQVRALERGSVDAGRHEVRWDGRDDQGRLAGSGVYYVRFQAEGFQATRSLVLRR